MEKGRETDRDKYLSWKKICAVLGTLLLLIGSFFVGGFITKAETNIQKLYEVKADKTDVNELKSDIKDIQKDIKILIRRN